MKILQTTHVNFGSFLVIENDLIGQFMINHGFWENHLIYIYSNLIKPTDTILDAGANIGFHTVQFARLGSKVYAYDPQPMVFNILSANILINGVTEKVEQYRLGLSDKVGTMKMESLSKHDQKNGMHNFGGRGLTNDETGEESVELVTFDRDVDVIKIDIQGSEIYAFRGMESVIDRCEPWIMLENYEDGDNDKKVLQFLLNKGYIVYRLMHNHNEDCFAFKPDLEKHNTIKDTLESIKEFKYKIHK
jgi:FkbM family methyltransferase